MITMTCFLLIGIGTFLTLFSLTKDVKCDLNIMQIHSNDDAQQIAEQLTTYIQFHSSTIQLSLSFSSQIDHMYHRELYLQACPWCFESLGYSIDSDIFVFYYCDVQHIANDQNENGLKEILFFSPAKYFIFTSFQSQHQDSSLNTFNSWFELIYSSIIISSICESGENVCVAFEQIKDALDQFDWHLLPHKNMKMIPTIYIATQTPAEIDIFGSIACNRQLLKMVSVKTHHSKNIFHYSFLLRFTIKSIPFSWYWNNSTSKANQDNC